MNRYLVSATAALLMTTVPASAAAPAANPASPLSVSRAATVATKQARLAGQWHGFPNWSLAVGAAIVAAIVILQFTNTDGIADAADSN